MEIGGVGHLTEEGGRLFTLQHDRFEERIFIGKVIVDRPL